MPAPAQHGGRAASADQAEGDAVVSAEWGDVSERHESAATDSSGRWSAERDVTSMASLAATEGLRTAWLEGMTGKGVTVALIDTGVAPVPGLDDGGQGPRRSGPLLRQPARSRDTSTVTATARTWRGSSPDVTRTGPPAVDPSQFAGVAPGAQLLNMKVGAGDGGIDVSQVIAALDWVVEHRKDAGMNVRVANLSYGTESLQSWQVDPLGARGGERLGPRHLRRGRRRERRPCRVATSSCRRATRTSWRSAPWTTTPASTLDDEVADFTNGGSASVGPTCWRPASPSCRSASRARTSTSRTPKAGWPGTPRSLLPREWDLPGGRRGRRRGRAALRRART